MVNRAAYQNIPADILKQLTTQNGYADFINFYHNSLSTLPNPASLQMMSGDEFYQAQYAKWQEVGIAWKNHNTQDQAKVSITKHYLDNTTYESCKTISNCP
jgi:hypothetical protein